jgi:hypothetical protein
MIEREEHVGCIDGSILTVRHSSAAIVLTIGASEASLSLDAARLLAQHLSPAAPPRDIIEEPTRSDTSFERLRPQVWDKIIHLIEADLLDVRTVITMTHRGEPHHATITADGRIDIDGETYDSPSAAAKHVTKTSRNGWQDWRVVDGPYLIDLRWRLRAQRFLSDDHSYSAATIQQKQVIARRWVEFALDKGLDPGKRDAAAVEDLLGGRDYAESTLSGYRSHLEQWFVQYDSSQ